MSVRMFATFWLVFSAGMFVGNYPAWQKARRLERYIAAQRFAAWRREQ